MRKTWLLLSAIAVSFALTPSWGRDFSREVIDPSYEHDNFGTEPKDSLRKFRAYVTSVDSDDDDDGDGKGDIRGIPEWVSYEMRAVKRRLAKGPARPSPWITVDQGEPEPEPDPELEPEPGKQ